MREVIQEFSMQSSSNCLIDFLNRYIPGHTVIRTSPGNTNVSIRNLLKQLKCATSCLEFSRKIFSLPYLSLQLILESSECLLKINLYSFGSPPGNPSRFFIFRKIRIKPNSKPLNISIRISSVHRGMNQFFCLRISNRSFS